MKTVKITNVNLVTNYFPQLANSRFTSTEFMRAKNSFEVHILTIHEGTKAHKCDSCGQSFFEAGYMKKHILTVHKGLNYYKCESCGKSFPQGGNMKKHFLTLHK